MRKCSNHWRLKSLTSIQLIQLHTVGNFVSCDYRLCDIFQFIPIRGGKLYGLISTFMGTLRCLTNPIQNDINAI
jgi:hypothetical protein